MREWGIFRLVEIPELMHALSNPFRYRIIP